MKEEGDLYADCPLYSFNRRLKIDTKYCYREAITLFPIKQNWMFVISNNQSFLSQIPRIAGFLGEKLDFFYSLGSLNSKRF